MRSYRLTFLKKAAREWNRLGATIRRQLAAKLAERLLNPHVPGDRLSGFPHCYRIKLKKAGYRLIYRVHDDRLVVSVVRIGRREGGEVYDDLAQRLAEKQ